MTTEVVLFRRRTEVLKPTTTWIQKRCMKESAPVLRCLSILYIFIHVFSRRVLIIWRGALRLYRLRPQCRRLCPIGVKVSARERQAHAGHARRGVPDVVGDKVVDVVDGRGDFGGLVAAIGLDECNSQGSPFRAHG